MGPLSALIRSANAISGQITSFRLVMTEPWTLSEVITGKSGCERGQQKKRGEGRSREDRRVWGEGDGIGWRSILIWSQKRGRGTDRHSYTHKCVCVCVWVTLKRQRCRPCRQVNVTQIQGRGVLSHSTHTSFVSLRAPNVCRQLEYIFNHNTQAGRSAGTAVSDDGDED